MTTAKYGRYSIAEVATFATDAPVAGSTWAHIPALERPIPKKTQNTDNAQESSNDGALSPAWITTRDASIALQMRVHTGSLGFDGASGDADPTSLFAQKLLESYFGAAAYGSFTGTTISGGTTAEPTFTSVSNLRVGDAVAIETAAGGAEIRFVTKIATSTVTLDRAITAATNGLKVYGAWNFRPTLGVYAPHHYVNCELGAEDVLLGPGRATEFKIEGLAAQQGARYSFGFAADKYAAGVTPTSLTSAAVAYTGAPLVSKAGTLAIAGTAVSCPDLSIDPGVKHAPLAGGDGANGRTGWEIVGCEPSVDITEYFSATRWTQYEAQTGVSFVFTLPSGSTSALVKRGSLAVYIPNAQVVVEHSVVDGVAGSKVKLIGRRPTAAQIANGISLPFYFSVFGGA